MKTLKFKKRDDWFHKAFTEDIQRIVSVCAKNELAISEQDAMLAWEEYSEQYYAAGWLCLPEKDSEVLDAILKIMEPEE